MVGATPSPLVLALGRLNHAATRSQRALRAREERPEWGSTPAPCPRMGRRVFYGISRRLEVCKRTVRNPLQGLGEGFRKPPAWYSCGLIGPFYSTARVPRFLYSFPRRAGSSMGVRDRGAGAMKEGPEQCLWMRRCCTP